MRGLTENTKASYKICGYVCNVIITLCDDTFARLANCEALIWWPIHWSIKIIWSVEYDKELRCENEKLQV